MKVKMLTTLSGTRNGLRWPEPGTVVELGDQEGADLCSQGVAEPVMAEADMAVMPAPVKAAKKTSPRKKA